MTMFLNKFLSEEVGSQSTKLRALSMFCLSKTMGEIKSEFRSTNYYCDVELTAA